LFPIFLVKGAGAIQQLNGPVIRDNLPTEGRGMAKFTAGHAVREMSEGSATDHVLLYNTELPSATSIAPRHKQPPSWRDPVVA
jgi:hypothetical protein